MSSARIQPFSTLKNQITDGTMRKIHERSDKLVSRIHHVDMTRQIVSVDHDHRETPHSFSKNVLTRD